MRSALPVRVSSPFGSRTDPISGGMRFHNGVDFAVAEGTTLQAADDGVVSFIIPLSAGDAAGLAVGIRRDDGISFSYSHMSRVDVVAGQRVAGGQAIGLSGKTGRATGPHLHFVVRIAGQAVDPLPFLPGGVAGAVVVGVLLVVGAVAGAWRLLS